MTLGDGDGRFLIANTRLRDYLDCVNVTVCGTLDVCCEQLWIFYLTSCDFLCGNCN